MINKFSLFNGAKYFSSGIFQNYLLFIPAKKYIKYFNGTTQIDSWKFNGMLEEIIENITKSDSSFVPTFVDLHVLPDINFNGHRLINNIYIPKKVINISYTLNPGLRDLNTDFTLKNCFFGFIKLIQINTNIAATTWGLILVQNFYLQMEAWEKISFFWS